jgi:TPR repeat protein
LPQSTEEILAQVSERVAQKDPEAMINLALAHGDGKAGLPVDQTKCIDLLREAADLGCRSALCQLGNFHSIGEMGLEQNKEEAIKYWEEAAEGGDVQARYNVGCEEGKNQNYVAAMCHLRLSASGGHRSAMDNLIGCFENGLLHHGDLAETMRDFYCCRAEMKSKDRDQYIKHLKKAGNYKEEYDYL